MSNVVFCWGNSQDGQLGIGADDVHIVTSPKQLYSDDINNLIVSIACGQHHTLIALENGETYSCGNNDYSQLGHNKSRTRLVHVAALKNLYVKRVAIGVYHSLVLHTGGEVYSWGDNSRGQLGRAAIADDEWWRIPKLVKELALHTVIQITCGAYHCIALTDIGDVWCWGANNHGQLGVGMNSEQCDRPRHLICLRGIPVAQIAAGNYHSFIMSKSGAIFGWGRNSFGQLGLNDEIDRNSPTFCKPLKYQRLKYISCGENHTAALTQEGGVYTFGAGGYGQLGHGTTHSEIMPKMVMELMGTTITQIACGRNHTLAYASTSSKLYAFGLGGSGQLGLGTTNNRSNPFPIATPFFATKLPERMETDCDENPDLQTLAELSVKRVYSGGDHCLVVCSPVQENVAAEDFRESICEQQPLTCTQALFEEMYSISEDEQPSQDLLERIEKVFSSASCLNGSFLHNDHVHCNIKNSGVDMKHVRQQVSELAQLDNKQLVNRILDHLVNNLISQLPKSPPHMEALRLYLILPEMSFMDQPHRHGTLITPFGLKLIQLDRAALRVLESWWAMLESKYFSRIVYVYKQCLSYIFSSPLATRESDQQIKKRTVLVSMEVLKKLNSVNESNGQIIPYHQFYVPEVKEAVNIRQDYIAWIQKTSNMEMSESETLLFCDYAFLFDAATKYVLLKTDNYLQMRYAIGEVAFLNTTTFSNAFGQINPCLMLLVQRDNIMQNTLDQLNKRSPADLKKPLKVIFAGEEAVDEGGVTKEFFLLIMREILNPDYGMFKYYEESRLMWFNSETFETTDKFHLIGTICGLAIYNFTIIVLPFPLALFKKLLNKPVTLDDLKELMPSIGRSLEQILAYGEDDFEEVFGITFEISVESFEKVKNVELVPGGAKKVVNKSNRKEFVDAYVDYIFNKSVEKEFLAFSEGFSKVCRSKALELLHPRELQAMVIGNEQYDFIELEKNTTYKDEYHRYHTTIKFFWEVFLDLSLEDKKKFLLFLTGSDRIPITGMTSLKMIIQPTKSGEDYLPVAHTCFNLLDLPRYTSKAKLHSKLLQAINQTEGFGLV
ncbi:probable E3 ubiquitin-protein ligase HERC4 [Octopus bimaculoides]|uniref:HECT domain-containing protein n=1 Tax=Octopus bimaculoides TaxID=37653 RepID=A0A0L8HQY3_OCTBM|nr:probable E3 ubiquitin-protein ligase HERC4 [Octopus bimaculoides]XP_014770178.1 probable E3 ubiquitin-protein ligase HERC4 [Octopus bimaculoides]XP_014770179.1 probable E3 ubiquitin-protein ligase HERC4 [Octopus bimaculoides]XP_052824310.1 probable E3 ubiquitin-protein ligase HERC4 [Octopus bimaculoides]|eukprot:XP_014770177.1 PREDICTED: probable E3 ubiquitin-protein ligase HERC4 [Octopus bimaculoides]